MELVVVVLSEVKADGNIKVVLSLVGLVVPWLGTQKISTEMALESEAACL